MKKFTSITYIDDDDEMNHFHPMIFHHYCPYDATFHLFFCKSVTGELNTSVKKISIFRLK